MAMAADAAMAGPATQSAASASVAPPPPTTTPVPGASAPPNVTVNNKVETGKFSGTDVVVVLGVGLIIVSGLMSGNLQKLTGAVWSGSVPADFLKEVLTVGGELVFLTFLAIIAELSDDARTLIIVFLLALWAVLLMSNGDKLAAWNKTLLGGTTKK